MSIKRFIPDFKNQSGTVNVELNFKLYPASSTTTNGPYAVTTSTTKVATRSDDLNNNRAIYEEIDRIKQLIK